MQTSLESPRIQIPVNPFLRAYFIPNIIARYSAALFVAIPTPSRNLQIFKVIIVKEINSCMKTMHIHRNFKCVPNSHLFWIAE